MIKVTNENIYQDDGIYLWHWECQKCRYVEQGEPVHEKSEVYKDYLEWKKSQGL